MTTEPFASQHPSVERYARHVSPGFVRLLSALGTGRLFVKAKGTRLWDHEGREYLDCASGTGAASLGHNPPALLAKMRAFLDDDAPNVLSAGPQLHAAELAAALTGRAASSLSMCLFSSTGGEAIESALKMARAATKRRAILYCKGGYHGTGMGALSVMGHGRMRDPFEPLVPECYEVPYGDIGALEKELAGDAIAAFVVEPIQVEAGVLLPPKDYLRRAQELCTQHGTVYVLDEVHTGLGRTGALFAHQAEGFVPDALVLGKSLGGLMVPIAATLTTTELHQRAFGAMDRFDLHGSTFSGNALACRTAMAALTLLEDDDLVARARARGERLARGLRDRVGTHPLVKEVRGRGLLVGLELGPTDKGWLNRLLPGVVDMVSKRVFGQWLALRLLEKGIVAQPAQQTWAVLKLEPPLTVTDEEIDEIVGAVAQILEEHRDLPRILRDVGERLGKQFLAGLNP